MADIVLSSSVRENLLALQRTAARASETQLHLSTGKKINSALDGANEFFTSEGLNHRAQDLSRLLDDIGQAVQTVKAADHGIEAISKLVDAARAKANQAFQAQSQNARKTHAINYNSLLEQFEDVAHDSVYLGKNLLGSDGNDLTVIFNEDNSSTLSIEATDFTDASLANGLNLQRLATGTASTATISLDNGGTPLTVTDELTLDGEFADGDVITFTDGNGYEFGTFEVTATSTVQDLQNKLDSFIGVSTDLSGGAITITSEVALKATSTSTAFNSGGAVPGVLDTSGGTDSDFATDESIQNILNNIANAVEKLRTEAGNLGTSLTIIENRQNFLQDFINTLQLGADQLILADTNEEGANLVALQTRQQLSSTALALASQADQSVLRLFG